MDEDFQRFVDLWEDKGNRQLAHDFADEVIPRYPEYFRRFEGLSTGELVAYCEAVRSMGNRQAEIGAEMFISATHRGRVIGGDAKLEARFGRK